MPQTGHRIHVQKARKPGSGRPMWLVLGDDYLPIAPIDEFLTFHDVTGSSPNTIRAYAHHLKLYWEYMTDGDLDWRAATLQNVIDFVTWLRWGSRLEVTSSVGEKRRPSTINAILAAVTAFRVYHVRAGTMAGQIEYQLQMEPGRPYKPFLHHVTKGRPIQTRVVKIKSHAPLPRTLSDEDLKRVMAACRHLRDKFLIRLLAETGMRIGQALGLRHSDIRSWDNEIWVVPRDDNANEARTKRAGEEPLRIDVDASLMRLYGDYLGEELGELDTDYVFVNLWDGEIGRPLTYAAVYDLFVRLEKRTGIRVRPHMERHSHATDLLRTGKWDLALVQKRLGHKNIATTAKYLHLLDDDLKTAHEDYLRRRQAREAAHE
jgi:integrase/recombinase XerD